MIKDFETDLAAYLNTRIILPFRDQVKVSDGVTKSNGDDPLVAIGVTQAVPASADLGSIRPEKVPGDSSYRRILRLECTLEAAFYPARDTTRKQLSEGLESLYYLLDDPGMKNGKALLDDNDRGFLIQHLDVTGYHNPLIMNEPANVTASLSLKASGWFWTIASPGEAGTKIGEICIREIISDLFITSSVKQITAGGPPIELILSLAATGPLKTNGTTIASDPLFGSLYCYLLKSDGSKGVGTLSGGKPADNEARLFPITNSQAKIIYTPPPDAAKEKLIISLEKGTGEQGIIIGSYELDVQPA